MKKKYLGILFREKISKREGKKRDWDKIAFFYIILKWLNRYFNFENRRIICIISFNFKRDECNYSLILNCM